MAIDLNPVYEQAAQTVIQNIIDHRVETLGEYSDAVAKAQADALKTHFLTLAQNGQLTSADFLFYGIAGEMEAKMTHREFMTEYLLQEIIIEAKDYTSMFDLNKEE